MNKYLLLRDNKQTGPYSVEELSAHGLKPYDLVWLEGRSAAWRYPSELAELKPFAPVVEEQPFDRFYKKPDTKTIEPAIKDNTSVKENISFKSEVKKEVDEVKPAKEYVHVKMDSSKKIHVSLPVRKTIEPLVSKSTIDGSDSAILPVVPTPVEKSKPLTPTMPVNEPKASLNEKANTGLPSQPGFQETNKKSKQKSSSAPNTVVTPNKDAPVSKLLFRTVAAACLLLGGALIGLIINYNSQQKKFQQLNQLVQEIKQQDNPGTAKTVKPELKENISAEPISDTSKVNVIPPTDVPVYKEDIQLPVSKKERTKKPVTPARSTPTSDSQVNELEAMAAVLKNDEPVQKTDKLSSELARKNLWQLVSVENNKFKTGVFGGVSNLSIKLSNKSLYQLEQVEIEILYLSPEQKTVNKQKVIFENVAPGEQLSMNVPKSSRGVNVHYSIKKISTKEFGLAHAGM